MFSAVELSQITFKSLFHSVCHFLSHADAKQPQAAVVGIWAFGTWAFREGACELNFDKL